MDNLTNSSGRSIKTKLTFIIMVVSALAIFLTSFASVIYNFQRFDADFTKELNSITGIIGVNMSAALEFDDSKVATQMLSSLKANSKIIAAYIFTPDGKKFSEYNRDEEFPPMDESRLNNQSSVFKDYRVFKRNIYLDNDNIGKIYVLADIKELRMSYLRYLLVVLLILFTTMVVVYFLSIYFQRFITNPISNLAKIVKGISYQKDYSLRAYKQSDDEIGYLVDRFNEMLENIEHRDEALLEAQQELENRVLERTKELESEVVEKNKISEILRESQQMLSLVMDNIPQAIFWKDEKFRYLGCNRTFAEHAGVESPQEVIGKTDLEFPWNKEEMKVFFESDRRVLMEGKPIYREIQNQRQANFKDAIIEITRIPLYDSKKNIMGILGTYEDITERKQLEDDLARTQKLESLGVLAGGIAHDFNNLLTGILGNISFANQKLKTGDDLSNNLKKAELASMRATDLTKQLLTFAKGGLPIKTTVVLSELLEQTASLSLRGSKIKCEYKIDKDLWPVEIDEGQISQVINNLIINADQSMQDGGVISIEAKNLDNSDGSIIALNKSRYVHVKIVDYGMGISNENIKKIFDPYFTTKDHGTGLGLATSYSVIKNHGGIITVNSELGVGSEFSFYLPATEMVEIESKPDNQNLSGNVISGGTILFMDDEKVIRDIAKEILEQYGFVFIPVEDGQQAIEKYNEYLNKGEKINLLILDLTIPGGMGGEETIAEIKKIDPDVRAVVSSGYSNNHIMSEFHKYGFINYLQKPYTAEDLLSVVNNEINPDISKSI